MGSNFLGGNFPGDSFPGVKPKTNSKTNEIFQWLLNKCPVETPQLTHEVRIK